MGNAGADERNQDSRAGPLQNKLKQFAPAAMPHRIAAATPLQHACPHPIEPPPKKNQNAGPKSSFAKNDGAHHQLFPGWRRLAGCRAGASNVIASPMGVGIGFLCRGFGRESKRMKHI